MTPAPKREAGDFLCNGGIVNPNTRKLRQAVREWGSIHGSRSNGNRQGRRNDNRAHKRDMRARGIR